MSVCTVKKAGQQPGRLAQHHVCVRVHTSLWACACVGSGRFGCFSQDLNEPPTQNVIKMTYCCFDSSILTGGTGANPAGQLTSSFLYFVQNTDCKQRQTEQRKRRYHDTTGHLTVASLSGPLKSPQAQVDLQEMKKKTALSIS